MVEEVTSRGGDRRTQIDSKTREQRSSDADLVGDEEEGVWEAFKVLEATEEIRGLAVDTGGGGEIWVEEEDMSLEIGRFAVVVEGMFICKSGALGM